MIFTKYHYFQYKFATIQNDAIIDWPKLLRFSLLIWKIVKVMVWSLWKMPRASFAAELNTFCYQKFLGRCNHLSLGVRYWVVPFWHAPCGGGYTIWQGFFLDRTVRVGWDLKYQIPLASRPVSLLFDDLKCEFWVKTTLWWTVRKESQPILTGDLVLIEKNLPNGGSIPWSLERDPIQKESDGLEK